MLNNNLQSKYDISVDRTFFAKVYEDHFIKVLSKTQRRFLKIWGFYNLDSDPPGNRVGAGRGLYL